MSFRKSNVIATARWEKLSYRKSGDFPGTAIILIHGAVGDSRLFRFQIKHFGARYKTIAVDLPGHGHSYTGSAPTLDDFTNAIEDIVREEGIPTYVLIGHSMGGGVCLEAFRQRLRGLSGMVLVSTSSVLPVSPALVDILERDDMDALAELIVGSVFSEKVDLLVGLAKKGLYEMNRDIIKADVEICKQMDYASILEKVDVPVLVIANKRDVVIASDLSSTLAAKIKNSRVVLFDHDGHVPFFEDPHSFNAAVDAFLHEILQK
jgi:pimeloyl-ACP methyl ester carboxylesterase